MASVRIELAAGNPAEHSVGTNGKGNGRALFVEDTADGSPNSHVTVVEAVGKKGTFRIMVVASAPKVISAGLYLFDFVTNILMLHEYWRLYKRRYFSFNYNALGGRDNLVPFASCLSFMVVQHVVNAVAFRVKLPPEQHPFRSAFFLPLVQLRRVVGGFCKAGSPLAHSGFARPESLETEALYAVMSAIETGPQLVIQFTVSFALGGSQVSRNSNSAYNHQEEWHLEKLLVVSVVASLLSASYNSGRAVMFQMSKRWTFTLNSAGIAGGMYAFSVLLLRCTTAASIVFQVDEKGYDHPVFVRLFLAFYYGMGVLPLSYMNGLLSVPLKRANVWSWASHLEAIVAAYMSTVIGPLYALVEGYGSSSPMHKKHKPKWPLSVYLGVATGINFLPDFVFLTLLALRKSTTCKFETQNTFQDFLPKDLSSTFTCLQFSLYIGLGIAFSILSCIILICSLPQDVQRRLDEMPIEEPETLNRASCSLGKV